MPFRERLTEPGLPTSSLNRSTLSMTTSQPPSMRVKSPIAADGGFGPMDDEDPEGEGLESDVNTNADNEIEEGIGEDFDDFEAGAVDEDFGDFNEEFEKPPSSKQRTNEPASSDQAPISPFVSMFVIRIELHLSPQVSAALLCKSS